jgi:hypothetical protein
VTQREPTQLTLGGGEVSHPPPRPRGRCPDCQKMVTLTEHGELRQHNIYKGERCPMSGKRPGRLWEP